MVCNNGCMPPFNLYPFQPTVPKFYENVDSQEAVLFALCCKIQNLIDYSQAQTDNINNLEDEIKQLQDLFNKFQESGFNDYYLEQISKWVDDNMACILARSARFVWFGIDNNGRFIAYIPSNWKFLNFGTCMDVDSPLYGRLTLQYNTETYDPCSAYTPYFPPCSTTGTHIADWPSDSTCETPATGNNDCPVCNLIKE